MTQISNKKSFQIVVSVIILVIGIVVWWGRGKEEEKGFFGSSSTLSFQDKNNPPKPPYLKGGIGGETYQNEKYGFSLELPKGAEVSKVEDGGENGDGETILVSRGALDTYQMQIHITEFDEEIALSVERIKQDIPDIKMKDEGVVEVGGVKGVAFIDTEQNTREIWFVRGGYLYQVTSEPVVDAAVGEVMQSWKFE